jgi:hypothetical protein
MLVKEDVSPESVEERCIPLGGETTTTAHHEQSPFSSQVAEY